ncbi:MarR family winged helix-turn-helix transcriptional regulator [Streptomyces tubbatahanensis]|uniref:MarR family winged helix-turn-helix transcriptional regulator n=1 Tax=Streptomyces tubbatahanensis TaxID=2923272 RepID=A0ABY3Y227_9ACTN|nr:MarR family winged helix-turn-helix transcriptional regulator [Streptomyces tubbatahanensis]UNT00890.1 MarR family winged helix-turn-helix transcriptional regulator [Streptomyces tubbatahanensis]
MLSDIEAAMVRIRRRQSRRSLARPVVDDLDEPVDLNTLAVIDAVDEGAGDSGSGSGSDVTVGFVADRLAIDPSRASRIVAEAVRSGFVRRVASQEDGRRSCLELTATGEEAVVAAHRTRQLFYSDVLGDWDAGEQREFARLLTKFVRSLDDAARD